MTGSSIRVNLKFFAGIDREAGIKDYDYVRGLDMEVKEGTRLRGALKKIAFKRKSHYSFFCNTERIGQFYKLRDGDCISCLKPVGGG